ncbi:MAG TPA: hypothetical protein VFV83_05885 [Chthoniobacteraceae bacterium]|nr:hypothetical protein [Chthoniobacteraceae bacterium]
MKQTTTTALIGALFASAALFIVSSLLPNDAHAQAPAIGGNEQYKIVSLRTYGDDVPRMEGDLNKLAADGWKVRTGVGAALVLAK